MAYRIEKETGDIVIDGFEQGVAPSPHKGMANIQNGNISTEPGEVMASFNRTAQITSATTASGVAGTLTASSGDGTTVLASSVALSVGRWISVSSATVQVTKTTETVSVVTVGGGGGGGGNSSANNGGAGGGGAGQFSSNNALSVGVKSYTVTVGAAGAGGTTAGTTGSTGGTSSLTHLVGVTVTSDATAVGGGGGGGVAGTGGTVGAAGASGGGGGAGTSSGAVGGAATAGNAGGTSLAGGGGGGGGSTAVGTNSPSLNNGGGGGAGTASSISGASVTYAGGGGGGGSSTGAAGAGGGGAGASTGGAGTAGTANTGGGGGGASRSGSSSFVGGAGGSGVVIISYPTGNLTATGGSMTTSGGNTIHTFNSSGTFAITAINTTQNLPAGNYFIDYSASAGTKVKISTSYDPSGGNPIVHGTTGTITFTTTGQLGKPIAKATETYADATGAKQYRYYILDNVGLVFVNDSGNTNGWCLTSPVTSYYGSQAAPTGMAVLNGFLLVFPGSSILGKPTTNLGTAFTDLGNDAFLCGVGTSSVPHPAFVGHQGRCYYGDGCYLGSIFPDTSTQTGGANVQSYCSYTAVTTTGTVTALLSGSAPQIPIGTSYLIPAVFYTDDFGTMPTGLTQGVVYWIAAYAASTGNFSVYGESAITTITATGALSTGDVTATLSAQWTGATKIQIVSFSNGDTRNVQFTHNSTAVSWSMGLSGSATSTLTLGSTTIDIQTGSAGSQYFNTFYPIGASAASGGITSTTTIANQRLNLPAFERVQTLAEVGNIILIGCGGNVVYPWNQIDATPSTLISLPESDVANIITVNQMGYIFAGHKGSVYITDGSLASQVIKVPDYTAGVPGSPATYIDPYFVWGDAMYLRGRVWFSVLDQTASKTGNCGGVWSFVPTQNLYIGQDAGVALRLENQNSYATYNGVATVLIPRYDLAYGNPPYFSGWWADTSGTSYGIDFSNTGTSASFTTVVETDAIPVGTMTTKKTFKQIEYKLSAPLDTGAVVSAKYRSNVTDAWKSAGALTKDVPSLLSGYFTVDFEKGQWLQIQLTITPITSTAATNTFVRASQIRVR